MYTSINNEMHVFWIEYQLYLQHFFNFIILVIQKNIADAENYEQQPTIPTEGPRPPVISIWWCFIM